MKYFIIEDNAPQGPYSIEELREKAITPDRLVWSEDMVDWTPAGKVEALQGILQQPPITPPDIPKQKKDSCLKRFLTVFGILFVALLIAMAISCPDKEAHKKAIAQNVIRGIQKSSENNNDMFGVGLQLVQNVLTERVFDTMLTGMLDYRSYLFFSKGSVTLDGKPHAISYGLFGKVFTMNEDDVSKYIDQNNPFANLKTADTIGKTTESGGKILPETTGNTNSDDLINDIETELVGAVGRIVKKQMTERTDSATGEALERIVDGVTDIIKGGINKTE